MSSSYMQLYARRRFFYPPTRNSSYYASVIDKVRAESQSAAFHLLSNGGSLSEEECKILRWGKNASGTLPKRLNKSKVDREIYREATAIECLVGYLYLADMSRLHAVMRQVGLVQEEENL